MALIGEAIVKFTSDATSTIRALQQVGDVAGDAGKKAANGGKVAAAALRQLDTVGRKMTAGLAAIGAASGAAFGGFITSGIRFNSSVENATATINAFTKSSQKTAEILKFVKEESLKTQFGFTDMAEAAAGLIPASKTSGVALEKLVRQAEVLAALNPAEGLVGAAFSLKEALSGDFVSIVERFNLPRKRLNELKEDGVPAIEAVSIALKEMGIDYSLVSSQAQTSSARFDTFKDQLVQLTGVATKPLFQRLSDAMGRLTDYMDKNQDQIEKLAVVFADKLVVSLERTVRSVSTIIRFFREHEDIVKAAGIALGVMATAALATSAAMAILALTTGGWVVLLIGAVAFITTLVVQNWDKITAATNTLVETVRLRLIGMATAIQQFWSNVVTSVVTFWNTITATFAAGFATVDRFFEELPERIQFGIGQAAGYVYLFATQTVPNAVTAILAWFDQLPGRITAAAVSAFHSFTGWMVQLGARSSQLAEQAIASTSNWFATLPERIASFISRSADQAAAGFEGMKQRLVEAARQISNEVVGFFSDLPGRIAQSIKSGYGKVSDALKGVGATVASGFKSVVPGFATGVRNFSGGLAVVGERGPELVNLPRGADVFTNQESRQMLSSPTVGGKAGVNVTVNLGTFLGSPGELRSFAEKVGREIERTNVAWGV